MRRCEVYAKVAYIVNIMDTTLLLIVLFERAVVVEFSIQTQRRKEISEDSSSHVSQH